MTWRQLLLSFGSLSLAGDDVAVGMWVVTSKGGWSLTLGDLAVIWRWWVVETGGDMAVVAVEWAVVGVVTWWQVVGCDAAVVGCIGVDELTLGWPKCGH